MTKESPRYVAIAAELRDRIAGEKLAPHTLMPSERELSEAYEVSRMTARQALALLENEGYVYRRPPRGTFVAEPRVPFHIGSFSDEIIRVGRRPAAQLLWAEEREPTASAKAAFDLASSARVHALHRLRFADDEPIALETTYFPADLTPGLLSEPLTGSLWQLLRTRYGVIPVSAQATIQSIVIDDASCTQLRIRSASSGILLTRWTFDEAGRCVEFARDVYRADRASFQVEARIPVPVDE
ncbi:GntR family transcriptional regulator [Dactylosporangium sp. AC04546]|uniref:GntR family transcriptional regulator n=1 Tax=Dactylosporangium sp. AC04546 TaxID=2862460 RepID=UPI001EE0F69E|nr:GntR family transcriptional regulator [Dactylosporangium sp. AC04546]WVK88671.1 GntR family transcriptional regulator [Dactylosporangium sp. AC04546]